MGYSDQALKIHLCDGRKSTDNIISRLKTILRQRGYEVEIVPYRAPNSIRPAQVAVVIPNGSAIIGLGSICRRVDERVVEMRTYSRDRESSAMSESIVADSVTA